MAKRHRTPKRPPPRVNQGPGAWRWAVYAGIGAVFLVAAWVVREALKPPADRTGNRERITDVAPTTNSPPKAGPWRGKPELDASSESAVARASNRPMDPEPPPPTEPDIENPEFSTPTLASGAFEKPPNPFEPPPVDIDPHTGKAPGAEGPVRTE